VPLGTVAAMPDVPSVTLNNGLTMPQVGFGVFQIPDDEVVEPVTTAIDAGYRLIDTAAVYRNERGVGRAIAEAGVPRDELFVTTKVWNSNQGYDSTLQAFDASAGKLGLDVVDLELIHWPVAMYDSYVDTWRALERLLADGRVRAIGVSNFQVAHLQRLFDETDVVPAVNQIELHPGLDQAELRAFHAEHGIVTEAWSPMGQGKGLLDDPEVVRIAGEVGRTPAQVVLRWSIQLGNVVIPKSATPSRIRTNLELFDFALGDDHMAALTALDAIGRVGPDPDTFDVR
jgi:2,5-diketo-D-gluconate reductase A